MIFMHIKNNRFKCSGDRVRQ